MVAKCLLWCCISITIQGCVYGYLYNDTTVPLTTDMNETPRGTASGTIASRELRIPISRVQIGTSWKSRGIADAAQRANLKTINYADTQTRRHAAFWEGFGSEMR